MHVMVWELIRASGLSAVLLLTVSVCLGVSVNVRALDSLLRRAWVHEAHGFISLLALGMTVFHVLLTLANRHLPIAPVEALVPFASGWRPLPMALGTLGLYLVAVLVVASCVKGTIGQRAWRLIHYGGVAGWAAAMLHGVTAGSDSDVAWVQYLYLAAFGVVAFLTLFRVLAPSRRQRSAAERA